jgi:hypothetical protein
MRKIFEWICRRFCLLYFHFFIIDITVVLLLDMSTLFSYFHKITISFKIC